MRGVAYIVEFPRQLQPRVLQLVDTFLDVVYRGTVGQGGAQGCNGNVGANISLRRGLG
jgi:hypothetical protein